MENENVTPEMNLAQVAQEWQATEIKVKSLSEQLRTEQEKGRQLAATMRQLLGDSKRVFATNPDSGEDGRKNPSPEKNLRISAVRAITWAKKSNLSKEEALVNAMKSARKKMATYGMTELPAGFEAHVNEKLEEKFAPVAETVLEAVEAV